MDSVWRMRTGPRRSESRSGAFLVFMRLSYSGQPTWQARLRARFDPEDLMAQEQGGRIEDTPSLAASAR